MRNEGMGINAATRVFKVAKNSIYLWLSRRSGRKETLLLYTRNGKKVDK